MNSCHVGWFPYSVTEGAVEQVETFTVLSQERGTAGEFLLSETLQEVVATRLLKRHFCNREPVSAVARHRGEVPLPQANDSGAHATSPAYYVDMNGEVDWDLADLNAADALLERSVLKTNITQGQVACGHADVIIPLPMTDLVDFARWRVLAFDAVDIPSS